MSTRGVKLTVGFAVALAAVALSAQTAEAGHRSRGCRGGGYSYYGGYVDYHPRPYFRRGCFSRRGFRGYRSGFGININVGRGHGYFGRSHGYGHHRRGFGYGRRGYFRRGGCRY
ncbi:MAG: hypothetical protein MI923_16750 [Phycisphaerales bacterium]|nr:hypothetical protein [Phycisphaerales bacterium]